MTDFLRAGDLLPDITLPDLDGRPADLRSYLGQKTLVFMWASW